MSLKRLRALAKDSKLSRITLLLDGEVIKFDKFKELRVNSDDINSELDFQPAIYSYLSSILASLTKKHKLAIVEKEKIFAMSFIKAKDDFYDKYSRNTSDEYASNMAKKDFQYLKAAKKEAELEEKVNTFKGIVRAYDQRANSVQQISANNRKDLS